VSVPVTLDERGRGHYPYRLGRLHRLAPRGESFQVSRVTQKSPLMVIENSPPSLDSRRVDDESCRECAIVTMPFPVQRAGDEGMVGRERWEEVRRLFYEERCSIARIGRMLDLDRKTVRRCVRSHVWEPYRRAVRDERLLAEHEGFLRGRAPEVCYSARVLYQELRASRGFQGSYETVKRFVAPLRVLAAAAEVTQCRFETPPGPAEPDRLGASEGRVSPGGAGDALLCADARVQSEEFLLSDAQ
jgi:hypothetical protein